jgi:hypothetical protein
MRGRGVERGGAFVDMPNVAVFVDHEGDTVGEEASEGENSVSLGHFLFGVAQERKTRARLLGKSAVSFLAVEADPQHLRARGFELGDISLIRLYFLRSTRRGGADIKRQHHCLLTLEIAELDEPAIFVRQGKLRGAIADL